MKAIQFPKYGSPDVLQVAEINKPTPKDDEVLVKVHAASVNSLDWRRVTATPFLVRLGDGLFKPKSERLGADVAGVVAAVGSSVTQFKPGDAVIGDVEVGSFGSFAEYVAAPERGFVHKPEGVSFLEASALPVAGLTAIQGLRNEGQLKEGLKVLVVGASGGVGHYAVQIAKAYGCEVTGVASTGKLEMVKSIGADHVIDYNRQNFADSGEQYDLIFDAAGTVSLNDFARALVPGGRGIASGFTTVARLASIALRGSRVAKKKNQWIGTMKTAYMDQDDLRDLANLLAEGKIKPHIQACFPLQETGTALNYLIDRRIQGKVVIVLEEESAA